MRQGLILLLSFLSVSFAAFSQTERQLDRRFVNKFYDANAYIYEDNYNAAVPLLDELNTIEPDNANIQYLLGLCYLKSRVHQKKAEEKLEYASGYITETYKDDNHSEQNAPPPTWFFLGQAYRVNLEFEKSINAFEKFLEYLDRKEKTQEVKLNKEETIRQIKITKRAKRMVNAPVSVDLVNMGQVINSSYSDHSPVIDVHESKMIYTSKRPRVGEPFYNQDEDLFVSTKHEGVWGNPERMGDHINTDENEASIGLSSEGDILLFFRSEYYAGNIFTTEKEKDSGEWSKPKKLTEEINTKNRETHACISPDKQSIYFTSDRPGGYGGLDIYVVRQLPTGEFGEPRLLGPNVNTEYDEETPFIHPDGQTLFFSSKGHNTMGGYDIFYSKMNEDYTFGVPTNLGYPINTSGDNVSYVMSMDGRRGYLSTYREDGYGDLDIYMIRHKDVFITNLAIYEGTVNDTEGDVPEDVVIVVRDSKTNAISGVYRPNKYTGEYILSLRPGAEYDIIYNVMGRQMVNKTLKPKKEDADQFLDSYRPVELDPVIIQLYAYHDKVLFEQGKTEMTASGNSVIDKIYRLVDTTRASMAITINYPPSHPLSPERFEVVKQELIKAGVYEVDIVAQGQIPSYAEIVYGLDITEGEELFLDIDLAATGEIDRGEIVVENILFDFDKYNIKPIYYENLNRLAGFMLNNRDAVIEIAGHTDHIGISEYNYLLSYRRAKAVKDYLVDKGVTPSSLITKKYGETAPIASNVINGKDNPEGRRLNRRVEFNVLKEGSYDKLIIKPVFFDFDKYNIKHQYRQNLHELADYMKEKPGFEIEIHGHTDHIGTEFYNNGLGHRRANSISDFLAQNGVDETNIVTKSFGENRPVAKPIPSDAARKFNRRAEFKIIGAYENVMVASVNVPERYRVYSTDYQDYRATNSSDNSPSGNADLKREYLIIVGSFMYLDNAKNAASRYEKMGYTCNMLHADNGFTRVAIKAFENKEDALQQLQRLHQETSVDELWILSQ